MFRTALFTFAFWLFLPQPPGLAQQPGRSGDESCIASAAKLDRTSHSSRDRHHEIILRAASCEVEIRFDGRPRFSDDFTTLESLDRGGRFRVEESARTTRRIEVRAGDGGTLEFDYSIDGRSQAFDASGRRWFESVLLQMFRRTAYAAKERVSYLLRRSGVDGVLTEIEQIPATYPQQAYMVALLEQADPGGSAIDRMLRQASGWTSDYYKAGLLKAVVTRIGRDAGSWNGMWSVARTIESDYYTLQVGKAMLTAGAPVTADHVRELLRGLDSDYYRTQLIKSAYDDGIRERLDEAVLTAARDTRSPYYRTQILTAYLDDGRPGDPELVEVIRIGGEMDSDYYRSTLLAQVARGRDLSGKAREAYLVATNSIRSRHYRQRALDALSPAGGR